MELERLNELDQLRFCWRNVNLIRLLAVKTPIRSFSAEIREVEIGTNENWQRRPISDRKIQESSLATLIKLALHLFTTKIATLYETFTFAGLEDLDLPPVCGEESF